MKTISLIKKLAYVLSCTGVLLLISNVGYAWGQTCIQDRDCATNCSSGSMKCSAPSNYTDGRIAPRHCVCR